MDYSSCRDDSHHHHTGRRRSCVMPREKVRRSSRNSNTIIRSSVTLIIRPTRFVYGVTQHQVSRRVSFYMVDSYTLIIYTPICVS